MSRPTTAFNLITRENIELNFLEIYRSLAHPLVRALAWSIGSPNVFNPALPAWRGGLANDTCGADWLTAASPWLQALDEKPEPLVRWMGEEGKRPLGKTFEMLIGFWLSHRADIAWVQPSLVVRRHGRTMGEFDHVYATRDGALHSLELTVKFYLRIAPERGARGYVGPMVYDFMAEKIARMTEHQMPLGDTEDGQHAVKANLARMRIPHDHVAPLAIAQHAISRGILFEHFSAPQVSLPLEASPAHVRGKWASTLELDAIPAAQISCWKVLDGVQWLGSQRASISALTTLAACAASLGKLRHAMIARFESSEAEPMRADEVERWIILSPDARVFSTAIRDLKSGATQ